jgi:anti-sigma-K factor RskA
VDVNEYIASGILESYFLGVVSEQERKEVECMSHIYPEIKNELTAIAASLEKMAFSQKADPPSHLKNKIFAALPKEALSHAKEVKVAPLNRASNTFQSFNRLLAAACLVMAVSMVALYFYQTSNAVDLTKKLDIAEKKNSQNEYMLASLREEMADKNGEIAMFRNPEFKTVFLKGIEGKPSNSLAIVCWNKQNKQTVIAVQNLPQVAPDKQYQLWAMVDDKPVSIGMIPSDTVLGGFVKMDKIANPQAFAITMENKGGSQVPTMEEMYVFGQIQ